MSVEADSQALAAERLSKAIQPMLVGKPPSVQGAALADLLAIWLAGHVLHDDGEVDDEATAQLREGLLNMHVALVESLVPINFATLVAPRLKTKKEARER